jgi:hypothetical protein
VTDGKIIALRPETVKRPVVQKPISITSPLPKEGKTPKITAKRYIKSFLTYHIINWISHKSKK